MVMTMETMEAVVEGPQSAAAEETMETPRDTRASTMETPREHIADTLLRGGLRSGSSAACIRAWEYPLAKDEQKHRVWQLYERELVLRNLELLNQQQHGTNPQNAHLLAEEDENVLEESEDEEDESVLEESEEEEEDAPVPGIGRVRGYEFPQPQALEGSGEEEDAEREAVPDEQQVRVEHEENEDGCTQSAKPSTKSSTRSYSSVKRSVFRNLRCRRNLQIENVMLNKTVRSLRRRTKVLEAEKKRLLGGLLRSVEARPKAFSGDSEDFKAPTSGDSEDSKAVAVDKQEAADTTGFPPKPAVPPLSVKLAIPPLKQLEKGCIQTLQHPREKGCAASQPETASHSALPLDTTAAARKGLNPEATNFKPPDTTTATRKGLNPQAKPFTMDQPFMMAPDPIPPFTPQPIPPPATNLHVPIEAPDETLVTPRRLLSRSSKSLPSLGVQLSSLNATNAEACSPGRKSSRDESDGSLSSDEDPSDLGAAPLSARGPTGPQFFDLLTPRTPGRPMQTPRTPGRAMIFGIEEEEDEDWVNLPNQKAATVVPPRFGDSRVQECAEPIPAESRVAADPPQQREPEEFAKHWGLDDGALRGLLSLPTEDQRIIMHLVDRRPGRNPSATVWSKVKGAKDNPAKMRLEYLRDFLDGRCLEGLRLLPSKVQEDVAMKLGDPGRCRNLSAFVWAEIKAQGGPRPRNTLGALPSVAMEVAAAGVRNLDGRALEALAQLPSDKRNNILGQVNPRTCRNPSAFVCSKVREMQANGTALRDRPTFYDRISDVPSGSRRRGGC